MELQGKCNVIMAALVNYSKPGLTNTAKCHWTHGLVQSQIHLKFISRLILVQNEVNYIVLPID